MRKWMHRLASLKIAIGLLATIVISLAAGTLVESTRGSDAARAAVYGAVWFQLLLALFALNVACSLADLWPWGWQRAGFVMTHGSMLLILAGALVTDQFKIEGSLELWEGEESASFKEAPGSHGGTPRVHELPFLVRLEAFEIDTYPGTELPAMFRSRVIVTDPPSRRSFPAVIEMNHELSYGGYRLFQSSYQRRPDKDQTILTVARDPGQAIVFAGYILLMGGMMTVLATRIGQARAASRLANSRPEKATRRVASLALAAVLLTAGAGFLPAQAAEIGRTELAAVRRIPVQHDGRVMPLDTLAREATRQVTGAREWKQVDPVALVLGWALYPDDWTSEPLISLGRGEIASAIGLPPGRRVASWMELVQNQHLQRLMEEAHQAAAQERPLPGLLREAQKVEEKLLCMQGFLNGSVLRSIPSSDDSGSAWSTPGTLRGETGVGALLGSATETSATFRSAMDREVTYNRVQPSRLAWWVLSASAVASLFAFGWRRRWLDVVAVGGLLAGFAVMTWGIATRWQVAGRIPASNMYESLLFLGWGVALFALVAAALLRSRMVILNAAAMSALTMALADLLPLDPFVHPVPPVLAGTAWLAIHVPIIMVSYSVLALGVLAAHLQIGFEIFAPARRERVLKMNDYLYWYIHIGAFLLIAGILTGSIWAASSWGRYWGWDPKEVWSLIAFLTYLGILHGRLEKVIGYFGVAMVSIVAFWTIVMTYVGVNYVLASGLHSYGFGGSGVVRWLLIVAAAETLFLGAGLLAHLSRRHRHGLSTVHS